jgi:hypothetical protein
MPHKPQLIVIPRPLYPHHPTFSLDDSKVRHRCVPQTIRHDVVRQLERQEIPAAVRITRRRSLHVQHTKAQVHRLSRPHMIPVAAEVVTVRHVRDIPVAGLRDGEVHEIVEFEAATLDDVLVEDANLRCHVSEQCECRAMGGNVP